MDNSAYNWNKAQFKNKEKVEKNQIDIKWKIKSIQ